MTDRVRAALVYINDLLQVNEIPFQLVGGMAALAYGATRPIADIDFLVPGDELERIAGLSSEHVVRAPAPYQDSHWDMTFMALEYGGQRIELGASEDKYFDQLTGCWREAAVDLGQSEPREVLGVVVPTMPLEHLLEYERRLGRQVDLQDVEEIQHASNT